MSALTPSTLLHLRAIVAESEPTVSHERYEVLRELGAGGMGTVYLAHDRELDREVALKVLHSGEFGDAQHTRMLGEARILASLEHPGIVPIHDVGTLADGRVFYVMKRVDGQPLDAFRTGGHSLTELLRVFRAVCDAVAFAHAAGVIHRDLKPQNVMVGAFGAVLVVDWGIAHSVALPAEQGILVGTAGYRAPEATTDARSDVYGLGGVLLFLLTGQHPGESAGRDHDWRDAPPPLRAICMHAREPDPEKRYASAAALALDLAAFADDRPVSAYRENVFERIARIARRNQTALLLILGYLVMRAVSLAFLRR